MGLMPPMNFARQTLIAMVLALLPAPALAHPHVWVTVETTVLYNAQKAVTGLKERWTFDDMYSAYALEGLDKNHDGVFDSASLKALAEDNMTSLKDYNYFTEVTVEGEPVEVLKPVDYFVERDEKKILHLTFTLPFKQPIPVGSLKLSYQVYDPEFYIAFTFDEKKALQLAEGAPGSCKANMQPPSGDPATAKTWGAAYAATAIIACAN
jgi:ABC-type uncharacterized transport system substrate-binding protein